MIHLAFELTILALLLQVFLPEFACIQSKMGPEGAAEDGLTVKSAEVGYFSNRPFMIREEHRPGPLQTDAFDIIVQCFSRQGPEDPVKVKGGEVSHPGQFFQAVVFIEMGINIIHHAVDALEVFLSGLLLEGR